MTAEEFSDQFDVLYNNITSNQAPGLTEYEKSVFLTKAQNEIVKNYFTAESKGNNIQQGFDDSAKRQADFSCLMLTKSCSIGGGSNTSSDYVTVKTYKYTVIEDGVSKDYPVENLNFYKGGDKIDPVAGSYNIQYIRTIPSITVDGETVQVSGLPSGVTVQSITVSSQTIGNATGRIDQRSTLCSFPPDVFIAINEAIRTTTGRDLQVIPLRYDEYMRLMSKPFKRPLKYQAWRLINTGLSTAQGSDKWVEIILGPSAQIQSYNIRYIRFPKPIIVGDLDSLTIDNYEYGTVHTSPTNSNTGKTHGCELDPIIHPDILQRAVELAKIAWTATGQDNAQMVIQAGTRSE